MASLWTNSSTSSGTSPPPAPTGAHLTSWAGNNSAALAASVFTPLLNQNMANRDICAPFATFVEMEVVHWLRHQLGFSVPAEYSASREIDGVLTLGGALSNTMTLMAARQNVFPGFKKV
ncbi:hypothetical protein DER46DRAFT_664427 [Fusarium sp. MPI-SDFR-AT-0072]|nr:hypothetical protein DER46DRAFT_664427 [Fusarium sp. MPI-SDFR-AT-0072]